MKIKKIIEMLLYLLIFSPLYPFLIMIVVKGLFQQILEPLVYSNIVSITGNMLILSIGISPVSYCLLKLTHSKQNQSIKHINKTFEKKIPKSTQSIDFNTNSVLSNNINMMIQSKDVDEYKINNQFNSIDEQKDNHEDYSEIIGKLIEIMSVSDKIKINDLISILDVPRSKLLKIILNNSEKLNLRIKGEYIITEENIIEDLDLAFEQWDKNSTKKSKID